MRYLLITFFRKPNGQIDEQVGFAKRLRDKDIDTCNVIVDYKKREVVKSVIEQRKVDTDFDKLNNYYKQIYPELIEQIERIQAMK